MAARIVVRPSRRATTERSPSAPTVSLARTVPAPPIRIAEDCAGDAAPLVQQLLERGALEHLRSRGARGLDQSVIQDADGTPRARSPGTDGVRPGRTHHAAGSHAPR